MTVYFLFLESIGTPELILIALVALIVFGPRKLPQLGKQIGKYTNEFKRASNEFRRSWEHEVEMAEREEQALQQVDKQDNAFSANNERDYVNSSSATENTIGGIDARSATQNENGFNAASVKDQIAAPEVYATDRISSTAVIETSRENSQLAAAPGKREWL